MTTICINTNSLILPCCKFQYLHLQTIKNHSIYFFLDLPTKDAQIWFLEKRSANATGYDIVSKSTKVLAMHE